MSNERLKAALIDAGVELGDLAEAVEVDAKTVERWLAGRTPYPRHRQRVAKFLRVDARDLWPAGQPPWPTPPRTSKADPAPREPETVTVYATPTDQSAPDWQALMISATRQIELLDHSLLDIVSVPGVIDLLAAKAASGCQVRILIAAYEGGWVAECDEFPDYDINAGDPAIVEINHARRHLAPLIGTPGIEIRQVIFWADYSMLRLDDQILYTPALRTTPRSQSPLLHTSRPSSLFDALTDDFQTLWEQHSKATHPGWYDDDDPYADEDADDSHDDADDAQPERFDTREADDDSHVVGAEPAPAGVASGQHASALLTEQEHQTLYDTLASWGVDHALIDNTLTDAVFGPGLIGLTSEASEVGRGVAIMVDEHRDPDLARLFDRRARLDDEAFFASWQPDEHHIRVLAHPDAPEALIAYTIQLSKPTVLRRTFLLVASKSPQLLHWLGQAGTNVWLIPQAVAIREWANEGAGTGHDLYGHALPLGDVREPSLAIQQALDHIGYRDT